MAVRKKDSRGLSTALHKSRFAEEALISSIRKVSFAIRIRMVHQKNKELLWPVSSTHKKHYRDLDAYIPEAVHGIFNSHNMEKVG